ncbi:MAG: holo-ACP synthase [Actinobacteria bacterium]|nr:holo-ACP synthase [Actinomycetota bacterium]NBY15122.1 holo-ACP synthase [Actinomycetota bacterium]
MAIVGIGVDVVDLDRFEQVLERTPNIIDRLFTKVEQTSAQGHQLPVMSLAGRFAVKEAVAKAIGAPAGMEFHDCEVSNGGAPTVRITGTVKAVADGLGVTHWHVSLSHDGPVAVAYVIAESRP